MTPVDENQPIPESSSIYQAFKEEARYYEFEPLKASVQRMTNIKKKTNLQKAKLKAFRNELNIRQGKQR